MFIAIISILLQLYQVLCTACICALKNLEMQIIRLGTAFSHCVYFELFFIKTLFGG